MVDAARARKLADRIQQIVAEMLERRIKDPRLGFVTVTDTRITNDLRDATVYYTVYGSDGERAETAAALESAKGVIRSEVGRKTGVRHTPSITFVMDSLMENAAHIDDLLAKARAKDAEVARAAQGAAPPVRRTPTASPPPRTRTSTRTTPTVATRRGGRGRPFRTPVIVSGPEGRAETPGA